MRIIRNLKTNVCEIVGLHFTNRLAAISLGYRCAFGWTEIGIAKKERFNALNCINIFVTGVFGCV